MAGYTSGTKISDCTVDAAATIDAETHFLGGIVGILAASLMNINAPYRPEGTKMAALGFATACVLGTLIALVGFIALLGAR